VSTDAGSTDAGPAHNGAAPEPSLPPAAVGPSTPDDAPGRPPSLGKVADRGRRGRTGAHAPAPGRSESAPVREPEPSADTRDAAELGLWEILREDYRRHYGSFAHPGLHVLAVYRLGRWRLTRRGPVRVAVTIAYKVVNNLVIRNLYGVELSDRARVGRRVHIGHHQTILIPPYCEIGDDCTLRHNLTIGYAYGYAEPGDAPKIGARVEVASGVQIIGRITVGDDARIGPGSIVMSDVPAGATVFAAPARIIRPASR
jgi:serine O-acetyltransferase